MKKTIFLVIDNLSKGGAEILLAGILPELNKKYSIILITLTHECDFDNKEILFEKKYVLGFNNKLALFSCIWKLKKIIKRHRPSLIHSHLFYSSLVARIACPANIPLIYSLHNEMSKNVFNNSKVLTFLEKRTIKKNHAVIAVSSEVLTDYKNIITKNNRSFILRNYISPTFLSENTVRKNFTNFQKIKLIAVGNIKDQKNYIYLIRAFEHLKGYNISIEIYGRGNERDIQFLQSKIDQHNLPITFKGAANNIEELLPLYDMYVSCSKHEGFGIAAVEAMASGLPLILSDLPVFHEITFDNALFFDVKEPMSFVRLIKEIFREKYNLNQLSINGIDIAKQYSKEKYLANLYSIYDQVVK